MVTHFYVLVFSLSLHRLAISDEISVMGVQKPESGLRLVSFDFYVTFKIFKVIVSTVVFEPICWNCVQFGAQ